MSQIGNIAPRTTMLLSSDRLLSALRRTQYEIEKAQLEIATGEKVTKPSDAPNRTSAILLLQQQLEARVQHDRNLSHAQGVLDNTDSALGDASDLLLEARSIASSQIGVGSNSQTRNNQATVIQANLMALVDIANRTYQNVPLFGGRYAGTDGSKVFEEFLGGVRYLGTRDNLAGDVGLDNPLALNSNGHDAFGALSLRVEGVVDLDPRAIAATKLADVAGALNEGIRKGTLNVIVNGNAMSVSLTDAETLGDVVARINAAIDSLDPAAGSISVSGSGLSVNANAGHTISIEDIGSGKVAADLGIAVTAAGVNVAGADLDAKLTERTTLASLGATVDFASGLKITNGSVTKVADFSTATTIQDMQNVIDQLNLGLRLEINASRTGLNLISDVSGVNLSIGENAGGSTATDLGLRTFGSQTKLADFRFGLGVEIQNGVDDFAVQLHDGSAFNVNLDGLTTAGEVITAIRDAALTFGLTVGDTGDVGTDFNVGFALDGNGFTLEDNTAGGGLFQVVNLGQSLAATQLGIRTTAGAGSTIAGEDLTQVRVDSVFTHLINLRDALLNDDSRGITLAGGHLETDLDKVARARADVGVRAQRVAHQLERSANLNIAEQSMLSNIKDADVTEVITRFTQLMQQLEASLRAGSQSLQLSFLDFLR